MEVSVAAVLILGALVAVRWVVIAVGAALILRPAKDCPACFQPTVPIRHRLVTTLLPIAEWRWCPACGWQGPSRKPASKEWTAKNASSRA